jgi:plastocyanin
VIVAVVVLVGGFLLFTNMTSAPVAPTPSPSPVAETPGAMPTPTPGSAPMIAAVSYNDEDGFFPTEVTIKKGGTVTWSNQGGDEMWVATAPHPAHTGYSGTSLQQHCPDTAGNAFDQCSDGPTYTFKFDKAGTFPYHNHSNATKFGRVVVVE